MGTIQAAAPYEAMEILEANSRAVDRIDLMLVDAVLPSMSGPEFAERVLSLHPYTRVLFMTGLDALAITLAFGKPCKSIQKPFSLKLLTSKVASMLTNSIE